jgi:hypothetical protein
LPAALREVVHHNAPFVIAENRLKSVHGGEYANTFGLDQMVRVDFDGTLTTDDNYTHAWTGPVTGDRTATVYFSAQETGPTADVGYYFLGFYWYHVQDGGFYDSLLGQQGGHHHDLEGVFLVVKKSLYLPYGDVVGAVTQAHGAMIPYKRPGGIVDATPAVASLGNVELWPDWRYEYNSSRPVAVVAAWTHGTYMAQNCNPAFPVLDGGYGAWLTNTTAGFAYSACIHTSQGEQWLLYQPQMFESLQPGSGLPQADQLATGARTGFATYQLIEVYQSPIWTYRALSNVMFSGTLLTSSQFNGYSAFFDTATPNEANPMWQWRGGNGSGQNVLGTWHYWYSFQVDGTRNYFSGIGWPTSNDNGQLLGDPATEARQRFPYLSETTLPYRYNPYMMVPPQY